MHQVNSANRSLIAALSVLGVIVTVGVVWLFVAGPFSSAAQTQAASASSTQASSAATQQTTSTADTTSSAAATSANTTAPSDTSNADTSTAADTNLTQVTGIFRASGTTKPNDFDNTFVESAKLEDGVLTLVGCLNPVELGPDGYEADKSGAKTQTWRFAVDDATLWTGSGGIGGTWSIQRDELIDALNSDVGLGFTFNVKDGYLVSADISS